MISEQDNSGAVSQKLSGGRLFLVGCIWPGAGQFIQKRWIAGSVYAIGFMACVVFAFVYAMRILTSWYGLMDPDMPEVDSTVVRASMFRMLLYCAAALLVLIVSFVDLYVSYISLRRKELLSAREGL